MEKRSSTHGKPQCSSTNFVSGLFFITTCCDPTDIDYVIPANDDATKSIAVDGLPAGFQLGEPVQLFLDRPDLQFVERAGRFLAVAADEEPC